MCSSLFHMQWRATAISAAYILDVCVYPSMGGSGLYTRDTNTASPPASSRP